MKKIIPCILLIVCIQYALLAQKSGIVNLKGKVIGTQQAAIEHATVSLLRVKDSAVLRNSISDKNGNFSFLAINAGKYIIRVSKIGFQKNHTQAFDIKPEMTSLDLPDIILSESVNTLAEVTVKAGKPMIEFKDDKIIFNVSEDPTSNNQMAIEALRKVPYISIDGDNNILLNGKSNFQIHLNGRNTGLFANNPKEALQSFPASLISHFEVITNPSAKYEGEGASGIINIVTKKKITGYNGGLGFSNNSIGATNSNINMSVKRGKLGITMLSSYMTNQAGTFGYTDYRSLNSSSVFAKRFTNISNNNKFENLIGNLEVSYEIDSLNALSIYTNLRNTTSSIISTNFITQSDNNGNILMQSNFLSDNKFNIPSTDVGGDYIKKFAGKKDKEFSIRYNTISSANSNNANISQLNSNYPNRFIINDNTTKNTQRTIQSDLVLPLSKTKKLELGVKAILRVAFSDYQSLQKDLSNNTYKVDPNNSNYFKYTQDIYSLYGVYTINLKKIALTGGVRFEQTYVNGNFVSTASSVEQKYLTVLPSISLNKTIDASRKIAISYTKKLVRPGINFLNPFVSNQDPLLISYGNTHLGPELIHNFEFRVSKFKKGTSLNLTIGESISTKGIESFTTFNPGTGVTSTTFDNIGRNYTTNITGFINTSFSKKVRLSSNLNLSYRILKNMLNSSINNKGLGGWGFFNISYTQSPKLSLNTSAGLYFPTIQLQGQSGVFYFYSISCTQKILKEKLTLTAGLNTFFHKYAANKSILKSATFYQETEINRPGRSFTVGLRYNFGKLKENVSKKKGVTIDDEKQNQQNQQQ